MRGLLSTLFLSFGFAGCYASADAYDCQAADDAPMLAKQSCIDWLDIELYDAGLGGIEACGIGRGRQNIHCINPEFTEETGFSHSSSIITWRSNLEPIPIELNPTSPTLPSLTRSQVTPDRFCVTDGTGGSNCNCPDAIETSCNPTQIDGEGRGIRVCFLTEAQTVRCTGGNWEPLAPDTYVSIAADDRTVCGISEEGRIACAGSGNAPEGTGYRAVSVDNDSVCGINEDGITCTGPRVSSWDGLDRGDYVDLVVQVPQLCALTDGGRLQCAGDLSVDETGPFIAIDVLGRDGCGLLETGGLWCWGQAFEGTLP